MATRFARNTVFSTIAGLCYSIGAFLTSIIVARVLGVDGAGVVALAIWIVTLTVALTDVGVFSSLTRFLPELTHGGDRQPAFQLASFLLRLFFLFGLFPFFFYALLALWPRLAPLSRSIFGQGEHTVLWILVGLGCITQALATFMQGYWRGMQQFDRSAYVLMVSVSFQLFTVTAGSILFGIPGALAGIFCGSILPALFCLTVSWREPPISCELRNRVVRYAVYCWSGSLASTFVWSRVELAFLNHYFGSEPVGLFSVGLTLSTMATQGPMLLTGGLLVFLSEHFGKKNFQAIQDTAATGTRIFAFMVLPLCFGMAAILPELLPLLYGPSFQAAVPAATVLVASAGVAACAAVASNVVLAHERSDLFALSGLVGVVLALLLGFRDHSLFRDHGCCLGPGLRATRHGGDRLLVRRKAFELPHAIQTSGTIGCGCSTVRRSRACRTRGHPRHAWPVCVDHHGRARLLRCRAVVPRSPPGGYSPTPFPDISAVRSFSTNDSNHMAETSSLLGSFRKRFDSSVPEHDVQVLKVLKSGNSSGLNRLIGSRLSFRTLSAQCPTAVSRRRFLREAYMGCVRARICSGKRGRL